MMSKYKMRKTALIVTLIMAIFLNIGSHAVTVASDGMTEDAFYNTDTSSLSETHDDEDETGLSESTQPSDLEPGLESEPEPEFDFDSDFPQDGDSSEPQDPEPESDPEPDEVPNKGDEAGSSEDFDSQKQESDEEETPDEESEKDIVDDDPEINTDWDVVYTYEELVSALAEDNGYKTVYLGDNITATIDGIAIHSSKAAVIIDGHPPETPVGTSYTFTQYATDNIASTIYLDNGNTNTSSITLRNMTVLGANPLGVIFVPESLDGVTVTFENLVYAGPQAVTNRGGTVRFLDCIFNMSSSDAYSSEELVEANHVQMGGVVKVTASGIVPILWLTQGEAKFCVLGNADVLINIEGSLIYSDTAPPDIHIYSGANFKLTNRGGFTQIGENIRNFIIETNAAVYISQVSPLTPESLRVEQTLEIQSGSMFFIDRTGAPGSIVHFPVAGGTAIFNNPARVLLFNFGMPAISFVGVGRLEITAESINMWQDISSAFGEPSHIWNDIGGKLFSVVCDFNTMLLKISHTLHQDAPVTAPLDEENFGLETAMLVTFGQLDLEVLPLYTVDSAIMGKTDGGAIVTVSYTTLDARDIVLSATSDTSGNFQIPLEPDTLSAENVVLVETTIGTLTMRETVIPLELPAQKLAFVSVSDSMSFSVDAMPIVPSLILRNESSFSFSVIDTRDTRAPWRIDASISSPLTAIGGEHVLHNALVFVESNGEVKPLSTIPLTVYSETSSRFGGFEIIWNAAEGVLLNLAPGTAYVNAPYTATIQWSLIDAP